MRTISIRVPEFKLGVMGRVSTVATDIMSKLSRSFATDLPTLEPMTTTKVVDSKPVGKWRAKEVIKEVEEPQPKPLSMWRITQINNYNNGTTVTHLETVEGNRTKIINGRVGEYNQIVLM